MNITKQQLLKAVGGNGAELGRIFNVTRQAINAMPDGQISATYKEKLAWGDKEQKKLYRKVKRMIKESEEKNA